ncbi:Trypsin- protease [Cordyceps fumosorosea ARSEF 2679]|uniref:Trypsin-protease n=1 Tax=Cordyceps fumosorosea (strain ARSEF 2679) TaxID=1081104 RepID=A0A167EA41_CORFA|nr:Trypsin- protease [Cordyceps fumosorosea ARSEF 2679]OAA43567.1 Trypsin- protease [Cordyceps fumosorosea ARSEF 2679]
MRRRKGQGHGLGGQRRSSLRPQHETADGHRVQRAGVSPPGGLREGLAVHAVHHENLGWTSHSTQSPMPVDQQVEEHCGRPGNDKTACLAAADRCKAEVKPDGVLPVHLECVDRVQVCDDSRMDKCIVIAKACQWE